MNKQRFLGYLDHIREMAVDGFYSDADGVVEALDEIIEKAEQLDESITTTVPYYPTYPWITTWENTTDTYKINLDNQSNSAYNIEYSDNFTVDK